MVVVDEYLIESGRTKNGGWTRKKLAVLGVPWPPPKGWKQRLERERRLITEEDARRFLGKELPVFQEPLLALGTETVSDGNGALTYHAWVDGACIGNPGPMGAGVVLIQGDNRDEKGVFLGSGTNNRAELLAVKTALEMIPDLSNACVVVHSDSEYTVGLLGSGWKAKANKDLVEPIRKLSKQCASFTMLKVLGHSGVTENEWADHLANLGAGGGDHEWRPRLVA